MPMCVVELKITCNIHETTTNFARGGGQQIGQVTDRIERIFAANGGSFEVACEETIARLRAYVLAEAKLLKGEGT